MGTKPSYIEIIPTASPGTIFTSSGDGSVYSDIVWISGPPIPSQSTLDEAILLKTKENMWRLIQAERDMRKAGGVLVGSHWFHTDDTSRIQHIGLVMMGQNMPAGIMWKTMSGVFIEMTPTIAQNIFNSVSAKDVEIFSVAENLKAQMFASPNPENFNYLNGTPSWPLIYGE